MDKINISLFGDVQSAEYTYRDFAGATVAMRREAPYAETMETIQWAVNQIVDDRPFVSAPLQKIITDLAIIRLYTNIEIEDFGSSEELYRIYDVLTSTEVIFTVKEYITPSQREFIIDGVADTVKNIISYRNSAAGLIEALTAQSDLQSAELQKMFETLQDPSQFKEARHFMEVFDRVSSTPQ